MLQPQDNQKFQAENGLAFGVEPNRRAYRLRLARYPAAAETVSAFVRDRGVHISQRTPVGILDIGVGSGRLMRYVDHLGECENTQWTGIDRSAMRLKSVYESHRWQLYKVDVEHGLPFQSNIFDVIYCEQLLEHLDNPDFLLQEIKRVLCPDGIAILGVPSFPPGIAAARRLIASGLTRCTNRQSGHLQTFTTSGFLSFCESAGFRVHRVRGFRMMSGGLLAPLENCRWFWLANRWLGERYPWLCTEIQIVAGHSDGSE